MSHLQNTTPGQAAPPVQVGPPLWKRLLCLLLAFQIGLPLPALAGTVAFSSIPLARASTPAAPNIMFILDDSGSMDRDFMPDAVADNSNIPPVAFCWDNGDLLNPPFSGADNEDTGETFGFIHEMHNLCKSQDVPFRTAEVNGMYYNPAVTYSPGVTATGASLGAQTTFTNVQTDPYEDPTNTTNLLN